MTRDKVKEFIKEKFGSYSKFATLAGIDRYELQKDFLTKANVDQSEIDRIHKMAAELGNKELSKFLTEKEITAMKKKIDEHGGIQKFSEDHGFAYNTVSQVLSGSYNKITPVVKKLQVKLKEL